MSKKKVVPLVSKPEAMVKYLENLAGNNGAYVLAYYGHNEDHFIVHNINDRFQKSFRVDVAVDLTNAAKEILDA